MIYNLKEKLASYHPNDEQLKIINSLKPINQPDYDSSELIVIPIAASNNLIHGSYAVWSKKSLELMTASYQNGGQDLMLDHEWSDSTKTIGTIFDAELWQIDYSVMREELIDYLLEKSPNPEWDLKILQSQGYYQVTLYGAVEASYFANSEFRFNRKSDVSIGGFAKPSFLCPLCSTEGNKVSFSDKKCPHYMPNQIDLMFADEEDLDNFAPYFIRDGFDHSIELSLVVEGNCPQAKIINSKMIDLLL